MIAKKDASGKIAHTRIKLMNKCDSVPKLGPNSTEFAPKFPRLDRSSNEIIDAPGMFRKAGMERSA